MGQSANDEYEFLIPQWFSVGGHGGFGVLGKLGRVRDKNMNPSPILYFALLSSVVRGLDLDIRSSDVTRGIHGPDHHGVGATTAFS